MIHLENLVASARGANFAHMARILFWNPATTITFRFFIAS